MKKYNIVLLSGDGIGPEISEVSKKVLKKLSKNHNFYIEIIEKLFVVIFKTVSLHNWLTSRTFDLSTEHIFLFLWLAIFIAISVILCISAES